MSETDDGWINMPAGLAKLPASKSSDKGVGHALPWQPVAIGQKALRPMSEAGFFGLEVMDGESNRDMSYIKPSQFDAACCRFRLRCCVSCQGRGKHYQVRPVSFSANHSALIHSSMQDPTKSPGAT